MKPDPGSIAPCTEIAQAQVSLEINQSYTVVTAIINSILNDNILHWSNLKAFADNEINVTENLKFVLERIENIMARGENAGYQHFLLFPQCFQKLSFSGLSKVGIVW